MASPLIAHISPHNADFFPTSDALTARMVEPYKQQILSRRNWQILDPSAGSGRMLDYLASSDFSYDGWGSRSLKSHHLYAIEADDELRFLLQGKDYKVIDSDFLGYQGDYLFDLILMNPPFARGDEHLLKAWEVLQSGHIACLLNEETVLNPFSARRKLLNSIIDQYGTVEFLGDVFSSAERKTDVRVALVRLEKKQKSDRFDFTFEGGPAEPVPDLSERIQQAAGAGDEVAINDLTGSMIRQYEMTKQAFVNFCRAKKELEFYSKGLLNAYQDAGKMAQEHYSHDLSRAYNGFVDELKEATWQNIIKKLGIEKLMTNESRADFNSFIKAQGAAELTKENIFSLIMMMLNNRDSFMHKAVLSVFDIFTAFHAQNRCHVEGWKTNSAWKVNQKIILPNWVSYGAYSKGSDLKVYGDTFTTRRSGGQFDDIDKVMCWLTGKDYDSCYTLEKALENRFRVLGRIRTGEDFDNEGQSEFFTYKFWRKGTLHITFKDTSLWEEFNYQACTGKHWLPAEEERAYRARKARPQSTTDEEKPAVVYPLALESSSLSPDIDPQAGASSQLQLFVA